MFENPLPTSVFPSLNKIFERNMYKRIQSFLSRSDSFFKTLFGLQLYISTTVALYKIN